MNLPTSHQVLKIHDRLVEMFAEADDPIVPPGPRDVGLIESACARPNASMRGVEKYKTLPGKAAALFHSLVKNHPFHNGNKRTALVTLIVCLSQNRLIFRPELTDSELFEFVVAIADNRFPSNDPTQKVDVIVTAIASWIREHTLSETIELSETTAGEFIENCKKAGAKYKKSGSWHVITGPSGAVHFNFSTKKLGGTVMRTYLRRLGLTKRKSGYSAFEFAEGVGTQQIQIRRFQGVLTRLAHA